MGVGVPDEEEVSARISALEERVAAMASETRTARLVVVDEAGRERLVATARGAALELELGMAGSRPGRSSEVLVFAVDGREGWPGGLGVQLWVDGSVARELTVWEDEL